MTHIQLTPKPTSRKSDSRSATEKSSIWNRQIQLTPTLGLKEKHQLFELLGILLRSGLTISDALQVLKEQTKKSALLAIYEQLIASLEQGDAFSESLAQQAAHFSSFEIQMVRMGEKIGAMAQVLEELSQYYEGRVRIRRRLIQVMSYPTVVILLSFGVVYFMMTQVVPMFQDVFAQFDAELPGFTQQILNLAAFIETKGWLVLVVLLLFGLGIWLVRGKAWFRKYATAFLLRIPWIGKLVKHIQLSRFALTLGALLKAKVRIEEALDLSEQIVHFYPLQVLIPQVKARVIHGGTIHEAIQSHALLPALFKQMVKVGEQTANLAEMLLTLGKRMEEENEAAIGNLTQVLEPLLVIMLGSIVGVILIAMYLPMFQLSQAISF